MIDEEIMKELTGIMNTVTKTHSLVQALIEDYAEVIATTDNPKHQIILKIKQKAAQLLEDYHRP